MSDHAFIYPAGGMVTCLGPAIWRLELLFREACQTCSSLHGRSNNKKNGSNYI